MNVTKNIATFITSSHATDSASINKNEHAYEAQVEDKY